MDSIEAVWLVALVSLFVIGYVGVIPVLRWVAIGAGFVVAASLLRSGIIRLGLVGSFIGGAWVAGQGL